MSYKNIVYTDESIKCKIITNQLKLSKLLILKTKDFKLILK